eukprot:COSAG01_NODE_1126_length_11588_cov_40.954652_4_plen_112_part_00
MLEARGHRTGTARPPDIRAWRGPLEVGCCPRQSLPPWTHTQCQGRVVHGNRALPLRRRSSGMCMSTSGPGQGDKAEREPEHGAGGPMCAHASARRACQRASSSRGRGKGVL